MKTRAYLPIILIMILITLSSCVTNKTESYSGIAPQDPKNCFGLDWNIDEYFFNELYPNYYPYDGSIFKRLGDVSGYINGYYTADRIDFQGKNSELIYYFEKDSAELIGGSILIKHDWNSDMYPDYSDFVNAMVEMDNRLTMTYAEQYGRAEMYSIDVYKKLGLNLKGLGGMRPDYGYTWITDNYIIWIAEELGALGQYSIFMVKKEFFKPYFIYKGLGG